jgi:glycosidase
MELNKWWHDKIVYQIYPKSFMDANNDGFGDIRGIIEKLDYLKDLGVDILWLTPYFASPMEDNGYDVADYLDINPMFGDMKDMDELLDECKKRDMYVMMDIVANHTSKDHKWFKESRSSKDNPYRDYYIWRDEKVHDMQSIFGGSAWEYDEQTKQYYLHLFAKGQPDLNWDNPKVLQEIADIINHWLDKGVKGIRFDVIDLIGKEIDNNITGYGPKLHERIRELNEKSFGRYNIITVGEAWGDLEKAIQFTDPKNKELDMVFQFECTSYTTHTKYGKFAPREINMEDIKKILIKYQEGLNNLSWNTLVVENHDLGRAVNRFGNLAYHDKSAKAIAVMNYFLKGTPYIYQGQEIGMTNPIITDINDYRDVEVFGFYKEYVLDKKVMTYDEFIDGCNKEARDNNRTPIQWSNEVNAGWNKGTTPWIGINPNYQTINVCNEQKDPDSILNFYKKLIKLRKSEEYANTFVYGEFKAHLVDELDLFIYSRESKENKVLVVTNMRANNVKVTLPFEPKKTLLSNYNEQYSSKEITLRPYEAFVVEI